MKTGQIKNHHVSMAASLLATVAIGFFFFWTPAWAPGTDMQMLADFAAMGVLLTYLWVQMLAHIVFAPATRNQMLADVLSIVPILAIIYVLAEYYRGDLVASDYQVYIAWLTAYAMFLDLVLDLSVALSPRRQAQ